MGNIVPPHAASLSESLRAFGYSFDSAIADIIDNSIYAKAKHIKINFTWSGENTQLSIIDDGEGMTPEELTEAMRAGTTNPLEERDVKDLGRFGLGLKTASFSQCRRLIVCTKKKQNISFAAWDLDVIQERGEWYLMDEQDVRNYEEYTNRIKDNKSGTIVIWEKIDRVCKDLDSVSDKDHKKFLDIISLLEFHLGMTFHRFIDQPDGIKISINNTQIQSWDPFMSKHSATEVRDAHIEYGGNNLEVRMYILPHQSKLTPEEYELGQGIRGWNDSQGFYIYRNRRLLIAGDWLGIGGSKEGHTILARIMIDLPNTMDHAWHIDVRKSKAFPPPMLKEELKILASKARGEATKIYRHRGKITKRSGKSADIIFVWHRKKRHGKYFYKINADYPLIKEIRQVLPSSVKSNFGKLLRLIGETIPSPTIVVTHSEEPDAMGVPYAGCSKELIELGVSLLKYLLKKNYSKKEAFQNIVQTEPFDSYPEVIGLIKEEIENAEQTVKSTN